MSYFSFRLELYSDVQYSLGQQETVCVRVSEFLSLQKKKIYVSGED